MRYLISACLFFFFLPVPQGSNYASDCSKNKCINVADTFKRRQKDAQKLQLSFLIFKKRPFCYLWGKCTGVFTPCASKGEEALAVPGLTSVRRSHTLAARPTASQEAAANDAYQLQGGFYFFMNIA